MYLYHFGIRELPFTLTPNTHYFFGLPSHKQAIDVLSVALKTGEGFIKVTGEVGTGKTLICRKLLKELPDHFVSAYIPNPYLSPDELRRSVANELNVTLTDQADQQEFTQRIQEKLIEINRANKSVVLIIDEAQALPVESIEALRLFTNLETESRKLLQVVLFGQPELDEKLARPELRQLKQRITFTYCLDTMDLDQLYHYVKHRMTVAGYRGGEAFNWKCCKKLFKATKGTPRLVNVLRHKALMLAYGEGNMQVSPKNIDMAVKDTDSAFSSGLPWLKITDVLGDAKCAGRCLLCLCGEVVLSVVNKMLQDLENRQGDEDASADYQPASSETRTRNLWIIIALILFVMVVYFTVRAIGFDNLKQQGNALLVDLGWSEEQKVDSQPKVSVNQALEQIMPAKPTVTRPLTQLPDETNLPEREAIELADVVSDEMAGALERSSTGKTDNKPDTPQTRIEEESTPLALIPEQSADKNKETDPLPSEGQEPAIFSVSVSDATPEERVAYLKQQARDAIEKGEDGDAIQALSEVLSMVPTDIKVRRKLAALRFSMDQRQATLAILQEGLVVSPNAYEFRLMLARLYFQQQQEQRALALLNAGMPKIEKYADYFAFHASLAQQLKENELAQNLY